MEKLILIDAFAKALFEPEGRRLDRSIDELIRLNRELIGGNDFGFMWQGEVFVSKTAPHRPRTVPPLHFNLRHEGDRFLRDKQAVKNDEQVIRQMMHLLIKDCETVQDFRDALPESLVELSSSLHGISRTRGAGYTLTDPRHTRQYLKALDKIDFYVATRLIY